MKKRKSQRSRRRVKPKIAKKPTRASSKVLRRKKKPTMKNVKKEEEDRVKVKLELEPKDGDDGKVDFNLDVAVDPDTPGKETLTTHLEGQVHLCSFEFVD